MFCPLSNQITTLNNIPKAVTNSHAEIIKIMKCIGSVVERESGVRKDVINTKNIDHKVHEMIAKGELHPVDMASKLINRERKLKARKLFKVGLLGGESNSFNKKVEQPLVDTQDVLSERENSLDNKNASSIYMTSPAAISGTVPSIF